MFPFIPLLIGLGSGIGAFISNLRGGSQQSAPTPPAPKDNTILYVIIGIVAIIALIVVFKVFRRK